MGLSPAKCRAPAKCREWAKIGILLASVLFSSACYSPRASQEYFVKAAADDKILLPIYSTSLYTVFFDLALQRCVMHAAHTWGEGGGGAGGTGIGITAFRCDPARVQERATRHGFRVYKANFVVQNAAKTTSQDEINQPATISKEGE